MDCKDMRPYYEERKTVAYFMRRLYRQKLTTTSGGNISVRLHGGPHDGAVAITPAQLDKGRLKTVQIGLVTLDGENLTPDLRMTSESKMHLAIYKARPDVEAIVHAHPLTASAFTASTDEINTEYSAEPYLIIGKPVVAPYEMTGTDELAAAAAKAAAERQTTVVLLENHGLLAFGATVLQAFDRLELTEAAAQTTLLARQLKGAHAMTEDAKRELDKLRVRMFGY